MSVHGGSVRQTNEGKDESRKEEGGREGESERWRIEAEKERDHSYIYSCPHFTSPLADYVCGAIKGRGRYLTGLPIWEGRVPLHANATTSSYHSIQGTPPGLADRAPGKSSQAKSVCGGGVEMSEEGWAACSKVPQLLRKYWYQGEWGWPFMVLRLPLMHILRSSWVHRPHRSCHAAAELKISLWSDPVELPRPAVAIPQPLLRDALIWSYISYMFFLSSWKLDRKMENA